jgi:hypothetical protein
MSNKIIQNYQNVDCMLTIEQAREHIDELTINIRGNKSYYRRHHSDDVLSKKEREEILLEGEIQAEIDFYENQIFKAKKHAEEIASFHLNDYCDSVPDSDEQRIDGLENKLGRVQETVYQLLGGLFNQSTQCAILHTHISLLNGHDNDNEEQINPELLYPTTRQGDHHEAEIQLLKHQVAKLEGTVDVLVEMVQLLAKRSLSNCECDKVKSRKVEPQEKIVSGKSEEILTYTTRYGPAAKWNENCGSAQLSNEDKDEEEKMWGYTEGACYATADFSDGDDY